MTEVDPDSLAWDQRSGLLPVVVQDASNLRVLMLGYMDRAALRATYDTGRVNFFSRSRQKAWLKGETSGHFLEVVSIQTDCDADTLLVQVHPQGPTCHLGRSSCFPDAPANFLVDLDHLIKQRERERPETSYITGLFESGLRRIAQKVGEEGVETALAAVTQDDAALAGEAADLVFHLQVLLCARGLSLNDAVEVLCARHKP